MQKKKEANYGGAVEEWLAHFILPCVGLDYKPEKYRYYQVSDDLALFLGVDESAVIEVERVLISTYYGYSVKLSLVPSTRKIIILEKEYFEGEESYLTSEYRKSTTGISRKWLSHYKGLKQWPR